MLAVDLRGTMPVAAAVLGRDGEESVETFSANGMYELVKPGDPAAQTETTWDLLPAPRRAVVWVNWHGAPFAAEVFESKAEADKAAREPGVIADRLACVRVELEEGRFDSEI